MVGPGDVSVNLQFVRGGHHTAGGFPVRQGGTRSAKVRTPPKPGRAAALDLL